MKASKVCLFVFLIMLSLFSVNILTVKSQSSGTIYIRADGTVDPTTAPIQRVGDIYSLTGNIVGNMIIQTDNIAIDGAGFTLQGTGNGTGIYLEPRYVLGTTEPRKNVTIKNMQIKYFGHGISLRDSSNNTISGNEITSCIWGGIYLLWSSYNTITGNKITNNVVGIHLLASSNNFLRNNNLDDNNYNLKVEEGFVKEVEEGFVNDADASNMVDGKPVYYWVNERDKTVPSDAGFVALINCTGITVQNLSLANNQEGILLVSTTNSTITRNTMTNNAVGIDLQLSSNNRVVENYINKNICGIGLVDYSDNNTISGNYVTNSIGDAISFYLSGNNSVIGNAIMNNGDGIYTFTSYNNSVYHNNFINNTKQVYDQIWVQPWYPNLLSVNIWDNGTIGNYWSDYVDRYPNSTELDDSGIWGTPYVIDANNTDRYPLMKTAAIPPIVTPPIVIIPPDTMPPTISIVSPEKKKYTVNNISLIFAVSEPTSWIGYSLDGQAKVTIVENTTLTGLSLGEHNLTVCARDVAGNNGTSETIYFSIAQHSEPFPTTWIAATTVIVAITVAGAVLLVYFGKIRKTREKAE